MKVQDVLPTSIEWGVRESHVTINAKQLGSPISLDLRMKSEKRKKRGVRGQTTIS